VTDRIRELEDDLRELRGEVAAAKERAAHATSAMRGVVEVVDAALTHARGALLMAREVEYELKRLTREDDEKP
jgi:hypothetical protein